MPTFTPKPEAELNQGSFQLLPEGDYDFEVVKATEKKSSKGNDMIELRLKFFSGSVEASCFDYLVFSDKAQYKIYQFVKAVGLVDQFKKGELTEYDCMGKCGRAHLKVDKSDGYDDKNTVGHYIPIKEGAKPLTKEEKDDQCPF